MRHEFTKPTKREALRRSGGRCEAYDPVYGLDPGTRCNAPLSKGVEFDHWPVPAVDPGSDTLDNCMAVCPTCHGWKTAHYDIPVLAKGKRVSDRHLGIARPPSKLQGRGFPPARPRHAATTPHRKQIGRFEETP